VASIPYTIAKVIHMKALKTILLSGAATLAALSSVGTANAAVINGGGASLPAAYWRQAANCYADYTDLQTRNAAVVTPILEFVPTTVLTTPPANPFFSCAGAPPAGLGGGSAINYVSTGSGRGIGGVFSNSVAAWTPYPGTQATGGVQYGISETAINNANRLYYDTGSITGTYSGAQGTPPAGGTKALGGALIQFPALIATVTIAFDPQYTDGNGVTRTLNIKTAATRAASGGLKLDKAAYCALFGAPIGGALPITDLNDARLTALNSLTGVGGVSLRNTADTTTFSQPIQLVGRSDSSGTTSLWTRHLSAVCNVGTALDASNPYLNSSALLPAGTIAANTTGKYNLASGNEGVAAAIDYTAGRTHFRIGYVGPDYVLPFVLKTNANAFGLFTADLKNNADKFVAPTPAAALAAFGTALPPQSTASGGFTLTPPAASTGLRINPEDWTAAPDRSVAQANPSRFKANGTSLNLTAYPIIGTSNFLTYTCFADTAKRELLVKYLNWYNTSNVIIKPTASNPGVLASAGLSPLPLAWRTAIKGTFYQPLGGALGLNLYVTKGLTPTLITQTNSTCTMPGGGVQ
jgi:phosphate transport system substrate-binding protein